MTQKPNWYPMQFGIGDDTGEEYPGTALATSRCVLPQEDIY